MNNNKLTCPQYISKTAYYSLVWIFQCMYVSVYYKYYLLTSMLTCLTGTSIYYWGDCTNTTYRYIDILFATTTLGVKSYIAIVDFTTVYKYIWFISLSISLVSYSINGKFVEYRTSLLRTPYHITYKQYTNITRMYYISTYIHMFFIHFLPTVTFSTCLIMTNYSTH
jgi:hypothetical protein